LEEKGGMKMFSWHWGYIAGWLTAIVIIAFLSLYPFYLIRYTPERYRSFWKKTGNYDLSDREKIVRCFNFDCFWMVK
jgi:hypothetical protein